MTQCCRSLGRFRVRGWIAFFLIVCLTWVAIAQEGNSPLIARSSKEKSKLREGSKIIDRAGRFSLQGERYHFDLVEADGGSFTLLENQLLERVSSAASNQDEKAVWTVTGVVTEYNGNRYLLLERAVLKPRKSS